MPVGEIKIWFVTGLETEEPVTKNFLTLLNDIQPPIVGVEEWDAFRLEVRSAEAKGVERGAYQGTNRR